MVAYSSLRFLHAAQLFSPSTFPQERFYSAGLHRNKARHNPSSSSLQHMSSCPGFPCAFRRGSTVLVMAFTIYPGRIDTVVDAGIKVNNLEFIPDILDIRYRANNCTAPPVLLYYPPSDGDGPSELDFDIYASMSMEDYEPPPPPRKPFGGPFEDYYDEAIGVDYIPKEEKATSSLLQFLDSLNTKKAKEEAESDKNLKKPLFSQSRRTTLSSDRRTLYTDDRPLVVTELQNVEQPAAVITIEDSMEEGKHSLSREHRANGDVDVNSTSLETEESMQQRVSSSQIQTDEHSLKLYPASYGDGRPLNASNGITQRAMVTITDENLDEGRHSLAKATKQLTDRTISMSPQTTTIEDKFKGTITDTRGDNMPLYSLGEEHSLALSPLAHDIVDAHCSTLSESTSREEIKGNSTKASFQKRDHEDTRRLLQSQNVQHDAWASQSSQVHIDQVDGMLLTGTERSNLTRSPIVMHTSSPFYEPSEGDIILGAVIYANDHKVDLEIGAKLPALMSLRDLQLFPQSVDNSFFQFPTTCDGSSNVPYGKSLLIGNETTSNSHNEIVEIGTVVIAEVMGRTIIDERAVISCRSAAQRMVWHRIEQLMRSGEAVQIEVLQWNEGGLLGNLEGVRAFLPKSELLRRPQDFSALRSYVGRTLSVLIVDIKKEASNIIMSEVRAWMSKNLQLGTVHNVTVVKVYSYGMQVEVDNTRIRGFVHISNFTKDYVSCVSNYFAEGDKAKAMLIKGRNPEQISFGFADLEKENGLLLRNKEQVFQDAEEMATVFRESLSEQERRIYGVPSSQITLDYQGFEIANLTWLHAHNVLS